jgi:hypothetical protein
VLDFFDEASSQEPGKFFAHGLALLLIEAPQSPFDQLGDELDVEGVLGDLPGDAPHFCRTPYKYVLVALEEVDEITFLFGV